jgi:hypothetical protein
VVRSRLNGSIGGAARGAWLRPSAVRLYFGSGAPTRLTRGPWVSVGEGVRRERHDARGPAREGKGVGRAQMNSTVLDLFKLI